jgi:hypothetical protein
LPFATAGYLLCIFNTDIHILASDLKCSFGETIDNVIETGHRMIQQDNSTASKKDIIASCGDK